ncbi:MAG: hypothetical protein N3I86_00485 [Verrucomicrobiae bacterium]|nr:hypothetical protein [Verrucomicrobiae bacterium]MDW8308074.1 hypothetical protein [Verrucomicrobiales bacterium]
MNTLAAIAARAAERNLPFLLAGGHAVIAHGHPRATFDIDLVIRRSERAAWVEMAAEMGFRFRSEGPTFLQFDPPSNDMLPLDLMLVNDETFAKLAADAIPGQPEVSGVKIVSLLHLLALKCHAIRYGHRGRIVKDADDVIRLVQVHRLDVNRDDLRELFLKYGTEELYESLRRLCAED